jgi:hypothetical protein
MYIFTERATRAWAQALGKEGLDFDEVVGFGKVLTDLAYQKGWDYSPTRPLANFTLVCGPEDMHSRLIQLSAMCGVRTWESFSVSQNYPGARAMMVMEKPLGLGLYEFWFWD